MTTWWVVLARNEYSGEEVRYGPFRGHAQAERASERWRRLDTRTAEDDDFWWYSVEALVSPAQWERG